MDSIRYLGKSFLVIGLAFSLASNTSFYADPELHTDGTEIISADFNASTGDEDKADNAESIEGFRIDEKDADLSGYVTNLDGKAILVDGRPVLQEEMENGLPRFQISEDGNGVKGLCDGLDQTCMPSSLNQFTYEEPDQIPIILITHNQHKYDTEGVGTSAYGSADSDPQPTQPVISADLTQNDPGTTAPSLREECKIAAKAGSSLPSLSSGCIDAANPHLSKPIPSHCATDFIGPTMPAQDQTCKKHSEVKKSADSHQFVGDKSNDIESDRTKKKENEIEGSESVEVDEKSKEDVEKDAEAVGSDAEEALKKVEDGEKSAPNKRMDELESYQEDSANGNSSVDETKGIGLENLNPQISKDDSAENSDSSTPEDIKILYGDDESIGADEDDSMDDNVNNEETQGGGFFENNSDWFNDDGTLTDPDDFENKTPDSDELSDMEDLLGLGDLGKEASEDKALKSGPEVEQEDSSPSTGDVSIDSEQSLKSDENLDVESLKINLNAVDEGVDPKQHKLSRVDEKTGVKIVKTKDGFIAKTFSLKNSANSQSEDDEVKLISKMNKEELMDRFNLSEDELEDKLEKCKEINPKTKDSDCLKEDASLFGDLLIKQD